MSPNPRPRHSRGFTLIELLVVVAVIAILSAIAYAAYQNHVLKTRRMLAVTCMLEYGQYLERYRSRFLEDPSYFSTSEANRSETLPLTDDRLAPPTCLADMAAHYRFTGGKGGLVRQIAFTIVAYPDGRQQKDKCHRLEWSSLRATDSVKCFDEQRRLIDTYQ